jgi:hypothetical protein
LAASTTLIKLFVEILEFSKNEIKFREIFFVKENKESVRMLEGYSKFKHRIFKLFQKKFNETMMHIKP